MIMKNQLLNTVLIALTTMVELTSPLLAQTAVASKTSKQTGKGPVKVFLLAGQSNMQGQGIVSSLAEMRVEKPGTLASMLKDPAKAPLLKNWVNAQGEWPEGRDDVWVWDVNEFGNRHGRLEFGYGWNLGSRMWFGPEMQFGHLLGDRFDNQVLIIKTAWGGRDLYKDFRPPSSGGKVGPFYTQMVATVNMVLGDLKKQFPGYDGGGCELAGFVWWHGWNDFCSPKVGAGLRDQPSEPHQRRAP